MTTQFFQVRLSKENQQVDQDCLNKFLDSVNVLKMESELISGSPSFWSILVIYKAKKSRTQTEKNAIESESELTKEEKEVYEILRKWRKDKATELKIPCFLICSNAVLLSISKMRPQSLDDFYSIKGFGVKKTEKYGEEILTVLNSI